MRDPNEYFACKVHRVVFHYDINKLIFELIGSKQRNYAVFIDTLYYTNTEEIIGKKLKDIRELGEGVLDLEKKENLLKVLCKKIGFEEKQLEVFVQNESYRFFEVQAEENCSSMIIAKGMEDLTGSDQAAS